MNRFAVVAAIALVAVACAPAGESPQDQPAGATQPPEAPKGSDREAALQQVRSRLQQLSSDASPEEVISACGPGIVANALKDASDLAAACGRAYLGLAQAALKAEQLASAQAHLANMRNLTGYTSAEVASVDAEVARLTAELQEKTAELQEKAAAAAEHDRLSVKWSYRSHEDEMTGRAAKFANIDSENTVSFDFPYQGEQRGTLMLRDHPSYGRDVILSIERGQLQCSSYDGCTVRVRFDEAEPQRWNAGGPSDNSGTVLFLRNEANFVQKLRRAKVVRIQVPVYQEGQPAFEFHVGGFDYDRYKKGS